MGNDTAVILETRRPIVGYTGGGRMTAVSEQQAATHLFTMRAWVEETGHGRSELRGALTHVLTGKTGYFRDWTTLIRLVEPFVIPAALVPIPSELEETSHDDLCF